jgi:hypothetical protein
VEPFAVAGAGRAGGDVVSDTTPAETLRKAAALMRGRAEALANDDWPGLPWAVTECSDEESGECPCIVYQGEYKPWHEGAQVPPIQYVCDAESPQHAEWIASMHPLVGAALADWLDAVAIKAEELLQYDRPEGPCCAEPAACNGHETGWACEQCGGWLGGVADDACRCWSEPLEVARLFLGEVSDA